MSYLSQLDEKEIQILGELIVEDIEREMMHYDDMDFYEAFVTLFKKWISENVDEKNRNHPFSYLVRKYGTKFLRDLFGDKYSQLFGDKDLHTSYWEIVRIAKLIVKYGLYKLPSARKEEMFTEKFKKPLAIFIKNLKIPEFVDLTISEPEPYDVRMTLIVDFPTYLKSSSVIPHYHTVQNRLQKFAEGYLGINIGSPVNGDLRVYVEQKTKNEKEWVENVFKKDIKKQIKALPNSQFIHRMSFEPNSVGNATLKIIFKEIAPRSIKNSLREGIKDILNSLGYKRIDVEANTW